MYFEIHAISLFDHECDVYLCRCMLSSNQFFFFAGAFCKSGSVGVTVIFAQGVCNCLPQVASTLVYQQSRLGFNGGCQLNCDCIVVSILPLAGFTMCFKGGAAPSFCGSDLLSDFVLKQSVLLQYVVGGGWE